jgi:hypothetical protein
MSHLVPEKITILKSIFFPTGIDKISALDARIAFFCIQGLDSVDAFPIFRPSQDPKEKVL